MKGGGAVPDLKFRDDGTFKIVQFSDIEFGDEDEIERDSLLLGRNPFCVFMF